ncbi:MAG: V-type ATP synthase subunit E family protein [Nitrospirota bacterium]
MGKKELIESLEREAGEKVHSLWEEAEKEAEALRAESRERLKRLGEELDASRAQRKAESESRALGEASGRVRDLTLDAESEAEARLREAAVSLLEGLRGKGYARTFRALAREVPEFAWERVTVNPRDAETARELFPRAEVATDQGITGGLRAEAREGRILVDNTFEKRLERAWDGLLPALMEDLGHRL